MAESSLVAGPVQDPLLSLTLGDLLEKQERLFGLLDAVVCPETRARLTYADLNARTKLVARALIHHGIKAGDRIAIFSGNCERYVELFFAASRIGAIAVVLNNTYTESECLAAIRHTGCQLLFTSSHLGRRDLSTLLQKLEAILQSKSDGKLLLRNVVLVRDSTQTSSPFPAYDEFVSGGLSVTSAVLERSQSAVSCDDVANFQFTSGTTGSPKAAMLTHHNIVNNGNLVGDRMLLTEQDIVCCPPPLFHCFGLVLGLLACVTHGSSIVFPSSTFDSIAVLRSLVDEKCTALHGVPTMLVSIVENYRHLRPGRIRLRTGIAAGASVPAALLRELRDEFGMEDVVVTYGMTETSPASFMSTTTDPVDAKLLTVGKVMPHTTAKVIDLNGNTVPLGGRGELCVSGYLLQKGYFNNVEKTMEVMRPDSKGTIWMHTGDEAILNAKGYCQITGRIKDIIIRGGENIYPAEIEERLDQHASIAQSSVVGLEDKRYGETVAAFLELREGQVKPNDLEIKDWVKMSLGSHKAPTTVFWLGSHGVPAEFPATGSGKVKKNELAEIGNRLVMRTSKL